MAVFQSVISLDLEQLPLNWALLQLVTAGGEVSRPQAPPVSLAPHEHQAYLSAIRCIEELALFLKPLPPGGWGVLYQVADGGICYFPLVLLSFAELIINSSRDIVDLLLMYGTYTYGTGRGQGLVVGGGSPSAIQDPGSGEVPGGGRGIASGSGSGSHRYLAFS